MTGGAGGNAGPAFFVNLVDRNLRAASSGIQAGDRRKARLRRFEWVAIALLLPPQRGLMRRWLALTLSLEETSHTGTYRDL